MYILLEPMIKLLVKFSPEYEIERVKRTFGKLQWYKDNGYNPKFPEDLEIVPCSGISEDQIKKSVNAEYRESDFKIQEIYLLENWHSVIDEASAELAKTSLRPVDTYTIYLTKYGVGGSYHYPDSVVVNISFKYEIGLVRTIFHEIVHLMIEKWIFEYTVGHWQKERIVDLLMLKFVPKLARTQQIPTEITDPVDRIFNEHYPDIEMIVKKVGMLPQVAKNDIQNNSTR